MLYVDILSNLDKLHVLFIVPTTLLAIRDCVYSFQIPLHEQEECPKAVRACPFAEFGCDFKVSVPPSIFEMHNIHVLLKVFQT